MGMIKYPYLDKWISDHGMTVTMFARYAGVPYGTMTSLINGKADPRKETIDKILKATKMKYERCFDEALRCSDGQ